LLSISPSIAITAAQLGEDFHKDPADRLIVATALELGASIVTKDEAITRYGRVSTTW